MNLVRKYGHAAKGARAHARWSAGGRQWAAVVSGWSLSHRPSSLPPSQRDQGPGPMESKAYLPDSLVGLCSATKAVEKFNYSNDDDAWDPKRGSAPFAHAAPSRSAGRKRRLAAGQTMWKEDRKGRPSTRRSAKQGASLPRIKWMMPQATDAWVE